MKTNRTSTTSRLLTLLPIIPMVLSLATCGTKGGGRMDGMSSESKNAEEAATIHKELMAQEDAIPSENIALWERVFMTVDEGTTMQEDGKNYGDFLLGIIGSARDQSMTDELRLTQREAEKIHDIKDKLIMIEKKYPATAQESLGSNMSMPADNDMTTSSDNGSVQKFPAFEDKDPNGNTMESDELFLGNAITVANFRFTTCNPCVGELAELDALNKGLAGKDGEIIGIDAFTLDGSETAISEAKDVLSKEGAAYRNVYFPSGSETGGFTTDAFTYPTTCTVGCNGNIVGDLIVGIITGKVQAGALQVQTDKTLSTDMG